MAAQSVAEVSVSGRPDLELMVVAPGNDVIAEAVVHSAVYGLVVSDDSLLALHRLWQDCVHDIAEGKGSFYLVHLVEERMYVGEIRRELLLVRADAIIGGLIVIYGLATK